MSVFTDAMDATLSGWTKADGTELSLGQKAALTDWLRIRGYENFLMSNNAAHRSRLTPAAAVNKIPVFWQLR